MRVTFAFWQKRPSQTWARSRMYRARARSHSKSIAARKAKSLNILYHFCHIHKQAKSRTWFYKLRNNGDSGACIIDRF